jgi:hypothetical protein
LFDHATRTIPIADIVVINDCITTETFDFGNNLGSRGEVVTFASERGAYVIDDDLGTFSGES